MKSQFLPRRARLLSLASIAIGTCVMSASAARVDWIGAGFTENWTNANNWVGLDRPDGGDNVYFWGNPARKTSYVNEQYAINNLTFESSDVGSSSFTINGSRELLIGGSIFNDINKSQTVNVHIQFTDHGKISNNRDNGGHGNLRVNTLDTNGKVITVQPSANNIDIVGRVYGTGRLVVDGPGMLSLPAQNDWTGGLEIKRGTVNWDTAGQLGNNWLDFNGYDGYTPTLRRSSGNGGTMQNMNFMAGEGRLEADAGVGFSYAGESYGAGDLAKTGAGSITLSGASVRTGRTFVRGGTLFVGYSHYLPDNALEVSAGATLQYNAGHDDRVASLNGGGTVALGAGARLRIGGTANDANSAFSGNITGSGVEAYKYGSSTLNLTGASTFGGYLDVAGGTALINNSSASASATGDAYVTVYTGATLGGDGRIAGTLDLWSGTVSPSAANSTDLNSVGSLAVGVLLNRPESTIALNVSNSTFDTISVSGAAAFDGNLALTLAGGTPLNEGSRELLHVHGSHSATFRNITGMHMSNGRSLAVTYTPHGVYITTATPGDANLDGSVNFDDLLRVAQNYQGADRKTWSLGDFDGNALTNFDDLLVLAQKYGSSGLMDLSAADLSSVEAAGLDARFAAEWALAQSFAPEPTALGLLGGLALLACRRR